jgi:predicted nucleic acid-binding protein
MADSSYLLDSNVLLRWVQPSAPDYQLTTSAVDSLVSQRVALCYTSQNVAEFWNACTRPIDRNGYGLSPPETDRLARVFESQLNFLADNILVHQEWRRLIVAYDVAGVQVHDARLVAAMHVHGIRHILTFNQKDFARYNDIEAIHPRSVSVSHP